MYDIEDKNNRRILVIDDNESIYNDFLQILSSGDNNTVSVEKEEQAIFGDCEKRAFENYEVDFALQGGEGLEKVKESIQEGRPYAVAFVDIYMPPGLDGIETVERIWEEDPRLQVVVCTAYSDRSWPEMIERLGETDRLLILKKPFDNIEIRQIACSLSRKWDLFYNIDKIVKQRTEQIAETRDIAVFALAKLTESRDPETGYHLERIRSYSQIIAEHLAKEGPYRDRIDDEFLENLYRSSPLHDIGKVGIPDSILLKPGLLSVTEFDEMKKHSIIGEKAIRMAVMQGRSGGFLDMAAEIARSHHERFDGSGYPDGLKGEDIPLSARIVALADVYDAITSCRVYKSAVEHDVARGMVEAESGKHFDPVILEAFLSRWEDILEVGLSSHNYLELAEKGSLLDCGIKGTRILNLKVKGGFEV